MKYFNRNHFSKTRTVRRSSVLSIDTLSRFNYSYMSIMDKSWILKYNMSYLKNMYNFSSFIRKHERSSDCVY